MHTPHARLLISLTTMLMLGACSEPAPGNKVPFKYEGSAASTQSKPSKLAKTATRTKPPSAAGARAPGASKLQQPAAVARVTAVPGLSIKRLLFAKDVVGREPVEPGTSFSHADTDKVWLFLELENATASALTLNVSFTPESGAGPAVRGVDLSVPPAKRHRTRAFTSTDRAPGRYRCVVRTSDGVVIADEMVEIRA